MTQLPFTKNADGWWEATLPGFRGELQVDRFKSGVIEIYACTPGCKEVLQFREYSESSLVHPSISSSDTLHILCQTEVTKAQYEEYDT